MSEYQLIRRLLAFYFSVETGLSQESAKERYIRSARSNPEILREVEEAFRDESLEWSPLIENDSYCVDSPSSPEDARETAKWLLLDPLLENGLLHDIE